MVITFLITFAFGKKEKALKQRFYAVSKAVSYTHLRAHETDSYLVCRLLLEKKTHLRTHETGRILVCRLLLE